MCATKDSAALVDNNREVTTRLQYLEEADFDDGPCRCFKLEVLWVRGRYTLTKQTTSKLCKSIRESVRVSKEFHGRCGKHALTRSISLARFGRPESWLVGCRTSSTSVKLEQNATTHGFVSQVLYHVDSGS